MSDSAALQELIDKAAVSDVVYSYATAVDTRDWALFRSLFMDPLLLDFSTFHPSLKREISVDELLEISMKLSGFDSTQHLMGNHRHTIDGDRATCISYLHAGHFMTRDGKQYASFLCGYYTYEMQRRPDGWKIDRYGLTVTAEYGDLQVMEWAGLR
jgi:ketosteroid isomerase-like protein